jgi:hypothetical protein
MYRVLNEKFTLIFVSFCSATLTSIYGYYIFLKIIVLENEVAAQKLIISNLNKTNEILQTQLNNSNKNLLLIEGMIQNETLWTIASVGILVLLCYFLSTRNIHISRNIEIDNAEDLQKLIHSKCNNVTQQILDALNSENSPIENIDNVISNLDFTTILPQNAPSCIVDPQNLVYFHDSIFNYIF